MNRSLLYLAVGAFALAAMPSPAADEPKGAAIKKCRDAAGKWHYGDSAAEACAKSKIDIIDERGIKRKEVAAPPTAEDLKKRELEQAQKVVAQEQAKKDEILLATYAHEADIVYVRDRKLAQVEASIRPIQEHINTLRGTLGRLEAQAAAERKANASTDQTDKLLGDTRLQIGKQEALIGQKREEQEFIRTRSAADLERYRALKSQPIKSPSATKP